MKKGETRDVWMSVWGLCIDRMTDEQGNKTNKHADWDGEFRVEGKWLGGNVAGETQMVHVYIRVVRVEKNKGKC